MNQDIHSYRDSFSINRYKSKFKALRTLHTNDVSSPIEGLSFNTHTEEHSLTLMLPNLSLYTNQMTNDDDIFAPQSILSSRPNQRPTLSLSHTLVSLYLNVPISI